jgi:hypothetical protein
MGTQARTSIYTKILSISSLIIAIVLVFQLFTYSSEPEERKTKDNKEKKDYAIYSLEIPKTIHFADERVPTERFDVKESLDRELLINTYWQSQTLLFIKRANRFFPIIEPILKENNVPDDFKYLSLIESNFMPRAVSPAGAVGLWQFMKSTGKEYGLEVSNEVDERYHIEKSTHAACKYLKKAYSHYGSWTLAAAAYNAGRTGVNRQLDRQKAESYYDLLLGEETGRYVYRILAIKEILSHPDKYGFHVKPQDLYQPLKTKTVEINREIASFPDFAQQYNISYKELKDLNPWLRDTQLSNPSGIKYLIKLPATALLQEEKATSDSTDTKI